LLLKPFPFILCGSMGKTEKLQIDPGDEFSIPRDELHEALLKAEKLNKKDPKGTRKELEKTGKSASTD